MPYLEQCYKATAPPPRGFWLCWGLTTSQPLWVILCYLPEKGRKKIEEREEEMKERDRVTGKKEEQKWKWRIGRNKNIPLYSNLP